MTDLLTKVLEVGFGLIIVGLIGLIAFKWIMKFKEQMIKKQKQDKTVKELKKLWR